MQTIRKILSSETNYKKIQEIWDITDFVDRVDLWYEPCKYNDKCIICFKTNSCEDDKNMCKIIKELTIPQSLGGQGWIQCPNCHHIVKQVHICPYCGRILDLEEY